MTNRHRRSLAGFLVPQDNMRFHEAKVVPVMAGLAHDRLVVAPYVNSFSLDIPSFMVVTPYSVSTQSLRMISTEQFALGVKTMCFKVVSVEARFTVNPISGVKVAFCSGFDELSVQIVSHVPSGV